MNKSKAHAVIMHTIVVKLSHKMYFNFKFSLYKFFSCLRKVVNLFGVSNLSSMDKIVVFAYCKRFHILKLIINLGFAFLNSLLLITLISFCLYTRSYLYSLFYFFIYFFIYLVNRSNAK